MQEWPARGKKRLLLDISNWKIQPEHFINSFKKFDKKLNYLVQICVDQRTYAGLRNFL